MTTNQTIGVAALVGAMLAGATARVVVQDKAVARSRVAIAHALPPLDGNHLEATIVEV